MAVAKSTSSSNYFTLQRICQDVLKGSIQPSNAIEQIKKQSVESLDVPMILTDILHSIDIELEITKNEDHVKIFIELCQSAVKEDCIPMDVLKLRIDALKQTEDEKRSATKVIAIARTRLYYKQLKFNLFREESEGYAKVVTELHDETDVHRALEKLRCLIGQFNLDPNRVLDVVLECFECRLDKHVFFARLLRLYNAAATDICCLLGFKLSFYQLSPSQEALMTEHKELDELERKTAAKTQVYNTAPITLDSGSGASSTTNAPTSTVGDMSNDMSTEASDDLVLAHNQKLGVLCALLECGDWTRAHWMLQRLPEYYPFARCARVVTALAQLIDSNIDTLYSTYCSEFNVMTDCGAVTSDSLTSDLMLEEWRMFVCDVMPRVQCLGPYIGSSPALCTKLVRLLVVLNKHRTDVATGKPACANTAHFEATITQLANQAHASIVDVCDECLVPALSIMNGNASLSEHLWLLMSTWPYTVRYRVYGRLGNTHTKRHAALLMQHNRVLCRARYVMKRLSKETTRLAGRQLSKLCHVHAITVFDHLLNQIQVFDNFIPSVVESLRYLTTLEYDMLSYCIIEHLANPEKQKLKADDAALSSWLQSLATFIGMVFRKYSLELTGVLQYVANELKDGNSFDLLLLKEIVETMSGIETSTDLTNEQLEALTGGHSLKQEGGRFGDAAKNVRRTSNRLRDALLQQDLVVALCLLTAQQRAHIAYKEETNLKLIGQMLDQCQTTLVQFGTFLSANLKPDDYRKRMPGAPTLIRDYHLPLDAAMFLARPTYNHLIQTKYESLKKQERSEGKELDDNKKLALFAEAFDSVVLPLADELHLAISHSQPYNKIGHPLLVAVFWLLETYDLETPDAAYDRAVDKLNKDVADVDSDRDMTEKARKKERERVDALIQKLQDERRKQTTHVAHMHAHIKTLQTNMFGKHKSDRYGVANDFVHSCVLPRVAFSELDAVYCSKFLFLLHKVQAVQFPTSNVIDRLISDVSGLLAGFTENEANCYGRMMCAVMLAANKWHSDQALFTKEVYASPGFTKKFTPNIVVMDYTEYRSIVHRWHSMISRTIQLCIANAPYLATRNAIFLLIKIMPAFPIIDDHLRVFEARVKVLRDQEKDNREDLCVLANSYYTHLVNRKRTMTMFTQDEFSHLKVKHLSGTAAKQAKASATSTTTNSTATATAAADGSSSAVAALTNGASWASASASTAHTNGTSSSTPTSLTRTIRQPLSVAASAVASIKRHVTNNTTAPTTPVLSGTSNVAGPAMPPDEKRRKVTTDEQRTAVDFTGRVSPSKRSTEHSSKRSSSHSKTTATGPPQVSSSHNSSVQATTAVLKRVSGTHAENGESKSKRVRSGSKEHRADSTVTPPVRASRPSDVDVSPSAKRTDKKMKKEKSEKKSREVPRSESRNRDR